MPNDVSMSETGDGTSAYRVLIVEDDRSQAQFAESILKGVGMWTCLVASAAEVRAAIDEFEPDLVLMDLHLPDGSGLDITAQLRQDPALSQLPIVFLTGDTDPETEFHVLDSGADDYLSKPIRPRHLISAVQSRVRRARQAREAQPANGHGKDPNTGLLRRDRVLPMLAASPSALLVEIQNTVALQDRYGMTSLEDLMRGAGQLLSALAPDAAARLNDNSFLVLADETGQDALQIRARALRAGMGHPIDLDEQSVRLRAAVGWSPIADTPAADDPITALEQALREARADPSGIAGHAPAAVRVAASPERARALEAALREERLELAFQPVVSVGGGNESRFQVLLRIRDADGNLHSAGPLLAAATSTELLAEVDRWVLAQALAKLQESPEVHRLFVAQTHQSIEADAKGDWLREALKTFDVAPDRLVIDLRMEDALIHNLMLNDYCQALAADGLRFCLGQYRHGVDAAAVLAQLPLTHLRLAREYAHLESEPLLADELREVIALAHQRELLVIGSQVETPSAAAALWMAGVDYIQGNLVQGVGQALDFDFHHSVL